MLTMPLPVLQVFGFGISDSVMEGVLNLVEIEMAPVHMV